MGMMLSEAKMYDKQIQASDLTNLFSYFQQIENKYRFISKEKKQIVLFASKRPEIMYAGYSTSIAAFPLSYPEITSIEPFETEKKKLSATIEPETIVEYSSRVLADYTLNLLAFVLSNGEKGSVTPPDFAGAFALVPHIRKTVLNLTAQDIVERFYKGYTIKQILTDSRLFYTAHSQIKDWFSGLSVKKDVRYIEAEEDDFVRRIGKVTLESFDFEYVVDGKDWYDELSMMNYDDAAELEMTSEVAEVFHKLRSISTSVGILKEVAKRPKSIFVCLKTAIGKFKVPYNFGLESAFVLNDIPEEDNVIVDNRVGGKNLFRDKNLAYLKASSLSSLMSNQLNSIDISRFLFDAMIVDEVHNFNRGFKKAPNLVYRSIKISDSGSERSNSMQRRTTLSKRTDYAVQTFNVEAKYSIRGEVQNFGAICQYIKSFASNKYGRLNKRVNNIVFLSATPFTDDNFQAYTLFSFLDRKKLQQVSLPTLAQFYRTFANELYKIDINIRGDVGLFPVIDGYKNTYVLSRIIGSFCDFAVSDVEIDKRRPKKVVIANSISYPTNEGIDDGQFKSLMNEIKESKINSFVPKSLAQKKMAQDGSDYIVGKISQPVRSTKEMYEKSNQIFEDILKWKKKSKFDDKESVEMKNILEELSKLFQKKKSDKEGVERFYYELINLTDGERVEELLERGLEIDSSNIDLIKYVISFESSEESDIDIDELDIEDSSAVGGSSINQQMAARTMQMAGISALALLSPYFVTNDKQGTRIKRGMNPYLPPLNYKDKKDNYIFDSFENAKTFVENSPKIYYVCEAIANQIRHQKERNEKVSGSIVYSQYFKFVYHGHTFKLFDLMSIYILGKYPELFDVDYLGVSTKKLSFEEKKDMFFVQIAGSEKAKDQVDKFNSGEAYVLFGTERIKEGVDQIGRASCRERVSHIV
jgi:hypothetical protein